MHTCTHGLMFKTFRDGSSYLSQTATDLNNQCSATEQKNCLSQINHLSTEEQLEEEIGAVRPSSLIGGCSEQRRCCHLR